ncbi:MAG: hypothetical protein JWO47_705 [Candidatus Saccharibacteria bacterium]|nr:hypothetical protein [Candidatus Saccharibacteria bacterium]
MMFPNTLVEKEMNRFTERVVSYANGSDPRTRDGMLSVVAEEIAISAVDSPLAHPIAWKKDAYDAIGGYNRIAAPVIENAVDFVLKEIGRTASLGGRYV